LIFFKQTRQQQDDLK
jgi:hypothetical protein